MGLEVYDADDPMLHVIDRSGQCYKIVLNMPPGAKYLPEGTINFEPIPDLVLSEAELRTLLEEHLERLPAKIQPSDSVEDMSLDELFRVSYEIDPDGYAGINRRRDQKGQTPLKKIIAMGLSFLTRGRKN